MTDTTMPVEQGPDERTNALIEAMLPALEADGFEVFVQPPRFMRPPFMHSYQPDAIALKPGKKIAIEVVSGEASRARLKDVGNTFEDHPDWELRVVYAPRPNLDPTVRIATRELIAEKAEHLPAILDNAGPIAALLTGWSVLEAAARWVVRDEMLRPQSPDRMLEVLASEGIVTPDEAEQLRRLAQRRNQAAHGGLEVVLTQAELDQLVKIIRAILTSG